MLKCKLDVMEYVVTIEDEAVREVEEVEFDDYDDYDDYDECGYDPYMGCYSFDC